MENDEMESPNEIPLFYMTKELKCSVIEEGTGGTSNASSLLETGKYSHRNTVMH
jgi:hypothetical protein